MTKEGFESCGSMTSVLHTSGPDMKVYCMLLVHLHIIWELERYQPQLSLGELDQACFAKTSRWCSGCMQGLGQPARSCCTISC